MTLKESHETRISLLEQHNINIMEKFEDVFKRLDKLDQKLDNALTTKADKEVVDKIQDNIRWVVYTIIGAILVGIISLIFK